MRTFKDRNGSEWSIEVDLAFIQRVKRACGINVVDLVMGKAGEDIASDPDKLGQLLWSVCEAKARERSIEPDKFPAIFDGDAIDGAISALSMAVADFLSQSRRELAMKVIKKGQEVSDLAIKKMTADVDALDASKLVMTLSAGRTSSAESPASIPAT